MTINEIQDQLGLELGSARFELKEAEGNFKRWGDAVTALFERCVKLQAALDALDGTKIAPFIAQPNTSFAAPNILPPMCEKHNKQMTFAVWDRPGGPSGNGWSCKSCAEDRQSNFIPWITVNTKPTTVTIDGQEMILEPGFKVGKNSFGEDVIVPEGTPDPPQMAEPTKPGNATTPVLSETGVADDFESPEEMF